VPATVFSQGPVTFSSQNVSRASGELKYGEEAPRLGSSAEKLLLSFMHAYYRSLARLRTEDVSSLFAKDARTQASYNRSVWDVMTGVRNAQKTDLSLSGYAFTLTVNSVEAGEDGEINIRATEDFTQNFRAYPGVDSKGFNVGHSFTLVREDDELKLSQHRQFDSLSNAVMGRRLWDATEGVDVEPQISRRKLQLISEATNEARNRSKRGLVPDVPAYSQPYDRDAAVSYARRWVGKRNTADWQVYDRMGGNCQNFVSQAIYAGGVPMDYQDSLQWKWFGDIPTTYAGAQGRSASWSGVDDFLKYVRENAGDGMVAAANAPYYSGEPGDVIHMGMSGDWRHTVMITRVMTDSSGNTVDYLVASNTADLLNFPVSAHYYQQQMLIKILGWNSL
jgi:hypothetical protein